MKSIGLLKMGGFGLFCCATGAFGQMSFNFEYGPTLTDLQSSDPALYANYVGGMNAAAEIWSQTFSDPITVNLYFDLFPNDGGGLALTTTTRTQVATVNVKFWMIQDRKTERDFTAVSNLPIQSGVIFTTNPPDRSNDRGPANTGTDPVNTSMSVATANQKALGIIPGNSPGLDGGIRASIRSDWDFDRSDGISMNLYDYVGTMEHEIGHAMGFISGVDIIDTNNFSIENAIITPLDLFRQSPASVWLAQTTPGVVVPVADFAFGKPVVDNISRNVYFSYDGGLTTIENFATGAAHGGQQASHFLYTGFSTDPALMFSNQSKGTEVNFSDKDIAAFDVIGYDPKLLSVPEPGAIALLALGLPVLIWNRRRKKKFSSTLRN